MILFQCHTFSLVYWSIHLKHLKLLNILYVVQQNICLHNKVKPIHMKRVTIHCYNVFLTYIYTWASSGTFYVL